MTVETDSNVIATAPVIAPAVTDGRKKKGRANSQFPEPKFTLVQDRYPGGQNCFKLFKYWLEIPKEMVAFAKLRVYRCWPEIDLLTIQDNKLADELFGECPFKDPQGYIQWFLDKHGAGDWRVELMEDGVSGHIMRGVFRARGEHGNDEDLDRYPPKLDVKTLINTKNNESYIRWLRRTQPTVRLPWDTDEGDMTMTAQPGTTAATPVGMLVDAVTNLAGRQVQSAEAVADARIEAIKQSVEHQNEQPNIQAEAARESIRMVTSTAENLVSMVTKNAGSQYDPIEVMKTTVDIMEKRRENDQPSGIGAEFRMFLDVMQRQNEAVIQMHKDQAEIWRSIATAKTETAAAAPPKNFLDQVREIREGAELFGWRTGPSREVVRAEPPPAPPQPSWLNETTAPILIMGAQTIFAIVANMVYNWATVKFKTGEPVPPGEAVRQMQAGAQQAGMQFAGQPQPAQQPQQPDPVAEQRKMWQTFIEHFTGPFINHLFSEGTNGYTLALFLQTDGTMAKPTPNGRNSYLSIKKWGRENFEMLMRGHIDLYSKVKGHPRLAEFLTEFFGYDEWVEAERKKAEAATAADQKAAA